jgi:hypothetical protein
MRNVAVRAAGRPAKELVRHPGLYRAKLSCKVGRDVIEGKITPPDGVEPMEWSMFNLLHAVEEIATAMMTNATDHTRLQSSPEVDCSVLRKRIAELEEGLRQIAVWKQEDQDNYEICVLQWRGCVAIASELLKPNAMLQGSPEAQRKEIP